MQQKQCQQLTPLLTVSYQPEHGLRLGWNFHGLAKNELTCFHIFLFVDECDIAQKILKQYYLNMKLGDIIGIFKPKYIDKQQKICNWFEKTQINSPSTFLSNFKTTKLRDLLKSLDYILNLLENKNKELYFINIVYLGEYQLSQQFYCLLTKQVKTRRQFSASSNKIFNLFSYYSQSIIINGSLGLNHFPIENENLSFRQVKNYQNTFCYSKVVLTLHFRNLEVLSKIDEIWKNLDFQTIQREYYGVSFTKFNQDLLFYDKNFGKNICSELNIKLSYILLTGDQYFVETQYMMKANLAPLYTKTFNLISQENYQQIKLWKNTRTTSNLVSKQFQFHVKQIK